MDDKTTNARLDETFQLIQGRLREVYEECGSVEGASYDDLLSHIYDNYKDLSEPGPAPEYNPVVLLKLIDLSSAAIEAYHEMRRFQAQIKAGNISGEGMDYRILPGWPEDTK
jgi:hypothetical protein